MIIISWLSNWAGAIIVAVVIGTIIEMILPEGNCKKYIKVVIGIYVLFTIISPVITKFTGRDIQVSDILDLDKYTHEIEERSRMQNTIEDNNENNIKNMYLEGIKDDMKAKINGKGYDVKDIDIDIANDESYNILTLNVNVVKENSEDQSNKDNINNNVEQIEPVNKIEINIGENNNLVNEINNKENDTERNNNNLSNTEKKELKEYLSSVYDIKEESITIN